MTIAMNRLVEYMEKHYPFEGNVFRHIRVAELLKETGWTKKEIFQMAIEAYNEGELYLSFYPDGHRWGGKIEVSAENLVQIAAIPEDLKIREKKLRSRPPTIWETLARNGHGS